MGCLGSGIGGWLPYRSCGGGEMSLLRVVMRKRSECVSVLVEGGLVVLADWCVCSMSCDRCLWYCVEGARFA